MRNQQSKNNSHFRPLPRSRLAEAEDSRTKRKGVLMFSTALCVFMVFLLGVDYVLQPQRFPTRHIDVIGNMPNSTSEQVAAAVAKVSANNILRVDIAKVAEAAQSLPWVEGATIRRKWPDTLEVLVSERVVLARWNDNEVLDQLGTVVSMPDLVDSSLPHLSGPQTSAPEVLKAYQSWSRVVANVDLEVNSVHLSDRGSWEISVRPFSLVELATTDASVAEPTKVIIGGTNLVNRSKQFLKLYVEIFQPVQEKVAVIDMRYPDGVAVTWRGAPPEMHRTEEIKNT